MELETIKKFIPEKIWDYTPAVLLGIGGLCIVAKVGSRIYNKISQQLMLARWKNTPKDLVIVHAFLPGITTPNASPFVIKLETYLRMANIPYQLDNNDPLSVKGKSPWITLNGEHVADSQLCIEFLAKKFGKKIGNYTDEERAVSTMARIMMDEHFYWFLILWRYIYTEGRDCYKFFGYPKITLFFLLAAFIPVAKKASWFQGMGRHSKEDVLQIALNDLKALSTILGNKKFLLGDDACEDDAAVFGELAQLIWCCPNGPYEKELNGELKNLRDYCFRMKETFWPDWEDCLSGGRKKKSL